MATLPVPIDPASLLPIFERARHALAEARTRDEVKNIRDQAQAIQAYLHQQRAGLEMQNNAADVKLRAERRLGEMTRDMAKNEGEAGRFTGGNIVLPPVGLPPTLADMGIGKMDSHRWQRAAAVPESEFERYIEETRADAQRELTSAGLLRMARDLTRKHKAEESEAKRQEDLRRVQALPAMAAVLGTDTFSTILIDPAWDWGDEGDNNQLGRARPTYTTMPLEQIMSFPVGQLADTHAHIYLWITNRSLPKGFALLDAWGFRYITCITWVKPSYGMGNYFRGQTEQCLFGIRGSLSLKRRDASTVFLAQRGPGGHSSKPVAFYDLIESCSPGPYLELFARTARTGWRVWGNGTA